MIATLLYRTNLFSQHLITTLAEGPLVAYLRRRISAPFESQAHTTVFYIFIGGVVAAMGQLAVFKEFKKLLEVVMEFAKMENE